MSAPRADIWLRRPPPARTALGWAVCSAAATHERWRSASRSDVQPGGLDNDPQHRRHEATESNGTEGCAWRCPPPRSARLELADERGYKQAPGSTLFVSTLVSRLPEAGRRPASGQRVIAASSPFPPWLRV